MEAKEESNLNEVSRSFLCANELLNVKKEEACVEGITLAKVLIIFLIFLTIEDFIKTKVIISLSPEEKAYATRWSPQSPSR